MNFPYKHLENLTYEQFKEMAADPNIDEYERIGFPPAYREGKNELIFMDIEQKLSNLSLDKQFILEIGPGCGPLPKLLTSNAEQHNHQIVFCDSLPVLAHLPDLAFVSKIEGPFPDCWPALAKYSEKFDVVLAYSMFHYVYNAGCGWLFLDRCLQLLAHGGQLLIGDIPSQSKRKRFFSSPAGIEAHKSFTQSNEIPQIEWNKLEVGKIDDVVLISMMHRARSQGFNAYIVPQSKNLPFANRREDILITRD